MTPTQIALKEPYDKLTNGAFLIPFIIAGLGVVTFIISAVSGHPEEAWLSFLANFLFLTALSAGGLLFSAIMHFTKATSQHNLARIAEAFSAFFPVSFVLFILLFLGYEHLFTWLDEDLHGKEIWLNIPFLFSRDALGMLILYLLGFGYLYHSLWFRLKHAKKNTRIKKYLLKVFASKSYTPESVRNRMTIFGGWYIFSFAMVLALIGFDLVMSMDPHWYSTLFGAYTFIKAIYIGFAALILLVSILHLAPQIPFELTPSQLRDLSTLFFGFSIVWGDFFYSQFLVIWYGNIPEETSYIIERTMTEPWRYLAWTVFIICFIMPFIILLKRSIKETPWCMIVISITALAGMWIEHFLLLGPCYLHLDPGMLPFGLSHILITLGFISLMIIAILYYFKQFPEILNRETGEVPEWK